MHNEPDYIKGLLNSPEIPAQRVRVVLSAIDKLPDDVTAPHPKDLEGVNKLTVELMDESKVAQYLQSFLSRLKHETIRVDELHEHKMFQAVLRKARELDAAN